MYSSQELFAYFSHLELDEDHFRAAADQRLALLSRGMGTLPPAL
jgi:hypothetical protein